jgi:hypothetical protein
VARLVRGIESDHPRLAQSAGAFELDLQKTDALLHFKRLGKRHAILGALHVDLLTDAPNLRVGARQRKFEGLRVHWE